MPDFVASPVPLAMDEIPARDRFVGCLVGLAVRDALGRLEAGGDPFAGSTDVNSAGNGSLMRLAPAAMFFAGVPAEAVARAADCPRTTHAAAEAVDACRYFAALMVGALRGESKSTLLSDQFDPGGIGWEDAPLAPRIRMIAAGSYKGREATTIRASGYVVHTLEAALFAFHSSSTFEEGALLAVNLGEDADTTGAVYGQLAGAFYGAAAIPVEWRHRLYDGDAIADLARRLHDHAAPNLTDFAPEVGARRSPPD